MNTSRQTPEAFVGFFVLVSLLIVGLLIFRFGKLQGRFEENYGLSVEVRDASGLRKGVPVRLGGVNVGYVSGEPEFKADYTGMTLPLKIYEEIRIPEGSRFSIGSDGLMGDKYIKIALPPEISGATIEPGTALQIVPGGGGLKSLQDDAEGIMVNVGDSVAEINAALKRLDRIFEKVEGLLTEENTARLNGALADIGESASRIKNASEKLDPLMGSAEDAFSGIKESAEHIRTASEKLDPLLVDAGDAVKEVKTAATTATEMLEEAEGKFEDGIQAITGISGSIENAEVSIREVALVLNRLNKMASNAGVHDGVLKALVEDPQLKDDLISLISKLEENGVIFYPRERDGSSQRPERLGGRGRR